MVTDKSLERAEQTNADRAQLLLIGSVVIAVVIVGIVVIINTVLVTENSAQQQGSSSVSDAAQADRVTRDGIRSLVVRLNHRQRAYTGKSLGRAIHKNLTNYSRLVAYTRVERGGGWVNISYHNETSLWGQRIVQTADAPLNSPVTDPLASVLGPPPYAATGNDNRSTWEVMGPSKSPDIGRFIVNINVTDSRESPVNITILNNSMEYVNISLERQNGDILVKSEQSFGDSTSDTFCDPSANRVLLSLKDGEVFTGDCTFPAVKNKTDSGRTLEPPYNISIRNGQNGYGKFSLVTNVTLDEYRVRSVTPPDDEYPYCANSDVETDPCRVPAVWQANSTVSYESGTINYDQYHNVSIYP